MPRFETRGRAGKAAVPRAAVLLAAVIAAVLLFEGPKWVSSSTSGRSQAASGGASRGAQRLLSSGGDVPDDDPSAGAGTGPVAQRSVQEVTLVAPGRGDAKPESQDSGDSGGSGGGGGAEGSSSSGSDEGGGAGEDPRVGLRYTERGQELQDDIADGKRVEWLHLPKTGTSFGNTLLPWVCPRLRDEFSMGRAGLPPENLPRVCLEKFRYEPSSVRDWKVGDHVGLTNRTDDELSRVFTMVRSPRQRLASGFHHVHRYSRLNATAQEMCEFARSTRVAHAAAGAQVRMVAGDNVKTGVVQPVGMWRLFDDATYPDAANVELACARLRRFAFVGLTELWEPSICLFYETYGGRLRPGAHKNVREGWYHRSEKAVKEVDCGDTADEALFACAARLFLERLAEHPECGEGVDVAELRASAGLEPLPPTAEAAAAAQRRQ